MENSLLTNIWLLNTIANIVSFIPFSLIDAFWCLCSRRLFENIVTKEEIAQTVQFLLLPQCFPLFVIGYPFNYRDFPFFDKTCSKSSATDLFYVGKVCSYFLPQYIQSSGADLVFWGNGLTLSLIRQFCSRRILSKHRKSPELNG